MHPCRVIGVAVNGQRFPRDADVAAECDRVERRWACRPATCFVKAPASWCKRSWN